MAHFQGRFVIRNGYHRLFSLRKLGHKFAPALLIDAPNAR
jgi:hypothetical protein